MIEGAVFAGEKNSKVRSIAIGIAIGAALGTIVYFAIAGFSQQCYVGRTEFAAKAAICKDGALYVIVKASVPAGAAAAAAADSAAAAAPKK
jgi:hypothetical protein